MTGCKVQVPPERLACARHWRMVPKALQDRIWQTYRVGQCDDWNPSEAYLLAAKEAVIVVATQEGLEPDTTLYDFFLRKFNAKP